MNIGDGRNIDPRVAELTGEGATQVVPESRQGTEGAVPYEVWRSMPSRPPQGGSDPTYYERPLLKEPVWIWSVPAYFYVGGVAGAASTLAAAARAANRKGELSRLVRRASLIGAGGSVVGTGLLVHDLGRPGRFLNMLRVFRPSSPMSVGSWMLAGYAPLSAGAVVLPGGLGAAAGAGAAAVGLPFAGYTAVLVANTAVPVWQATRRSLPPLFVASGMAGAASLLDLLPLTAAEQRVVRRYGIIGKLAELAAAEAVRHEAEVVPQVGKSMKEGVAGKLWRLSQLATGASLLLSILPGGSRRRRATAGVLGTAGSLGVKVAIFRAGKASARDPRATFHQQRAGRGAVEVTGG